MDEVSQGYISAELLVHGSKDRLISGGLFGVNRGGGDGFFHVLAKGWQLCLFETVGDMHGSCCRLTEGLQPVG